MGLNGVSHHFAASGAYGKAVGGPRTPAGGRGRLSTGRFRL